MGIKRIKIRPLLTRIIRHKNSNRLLLIPSFQDRQCRSNNESLFYIICPDFFSFKESTRSNIIQCDFGVFYDDFMYTLYSWENKNSIGTTNRYTQGTNTKINIKIGKIVTKAQRLIKNSRMEPLYCIPNAIKKQELKIFELLNYKFSMLLNAKYLNMITRQAYYYDHFNETQFFEPLQLYIIIYTVY